MRHDNAVSVNRSHSQGAFVVKPIQKHGVSASLRRLASRRMASAVAVSALFALSAASAQAANKTWTGSAGDTDWATGANWGGTVPVTGDALIFTSVNASPSTTLTNTLTNSGFNIAGITFNALSPAYTMTGNTFNLTNGITNNSGNLQAFSNTGGLSTTVSATFTVSNVGGVTVTNGLINAIGSTTGQTITSANTGGLLTLGGYDMASVAGSGVRTNTFSGTGNITISGPIFASISGALNSNVFYSGTGTLTLNGSTASTYTGLTTINTGTEVLDFANLATPTDLLNSSSGLTLNGGILVVKGKSVGTTSQSLLNNPTNASRFNVNAGGASGITLNSNGGSGTTLTLSSAYARSVGGTVNIDLSSANTTLATAVAANTLGFATVKDATGVGFARATGTGIVRLTAFTPLTSASTSSASTDFSVSGNVTLPTANFSANSLTIDSTGGGTLDLGGPTDLLILTQRAVLMTGADNYTIQNGLLGQGVETIIHQMGTGVLTVNATVTNGAGSFTTDGPGTINLASTNTFTGATAVNAGTLNLTGSLAGSPITVYRNAALTESSTGVIGGASTFRNFGQTLLAGPNTNTGATTISFGTLQYANTTAMSATSAITVGSGNKAAPAVLAVNVGGPGEFTNASSGAGSFGGLLASIGGQGNAITYNFGSALGLDTTNAPGGTFTYSTAFADIGGNSTGLTKLGAGTLVLTTANNLNGVINLNGGTISAGVNQAIGNGTITFTGGNLQYAGTNTADYSARIRFSASPVSIDTNGIAVSYNSGIDGTNTAGLIKSGAGQLRLGGQSGYTGTTTIAGGVLAIGALDGVGTGALGNGGNITFTGGTLSFAGSKPDYASRIKNSTSAIILDTGTVNPVLAGNIDGSNTAGLTKLSTAGTSLYLTGTNAYNGLTTITGGVLQLGTNTTTGSIKGGTDPANAIVDNANLNIQRSNAAVQGTDFSGVPITGSGSLTQSGGGTTTLTTNNAYTGGTTVTGGRLSGKGDSFGPGDIATTTNGTVDYSQATPGAAANNITGTGKVSINGNAAGANGGGGAITYTAQITTAGTTTVNNGGSLLLSHAGGGALSGPVAAAVGGTVGLGSDNQINPTSNVTLSGGTLAANGHSEGAAGTPGLGTLAVLDSNPSGTASTLDFGDAGGANANTLAFSDSSGLAWTGTVQLTNYTDGADKLYIGLTNDLTPDQLSRIKFSNLVASQNPDGLVTFAAAPEPSGWASMIIGMGVLGGVIARKRRKTASALAA